jgi:ubiquinone biosynthesis protein COQ9
MADATARTDPREIEDHLIDAALTHVPFDGWSDATLRAAAADAGVEPALARALYPRGAVDLALAFHRRGDRRMIDRLAATELDGLRFRDRVAMAVRLRLEVVARDKEAVRRGVTLFALPQNAAAGAGAIWGTADAIWTALGDTSRDYNWYTKRATLSAVWSSTVLYWLGDDSPDMAATAAFIDRRIGDVMAFEGFKGRVLASPFGKLMEKGPMRLLDHVRAPDDWRDRAPGFLRG